MITYKDIYEAAKKERYSENLQPIPKSFVKDVAKYLKEKREVSMKEDNIFSDALIKTKKQLENATTLFNELLRRRRKKILNLVLIASETGISKQDFENMLLVEKSLFEDLIECLERSDKKLAELLNGKKDDGLCGNLLIAFSEETSEFVAPTGETFGPYEKGQFVNIPRDVAGIFVEDGKAVVMEK